MTADDSDEDDGATDSERRNCTTAPADAFDPGAPGGAGYSGASAQASVHGGVAGMADARGSWPAGVAAGRFGYFFTHVVKPVSLMHALAGCPTFSEPPIVFDRTTATLKTRGAPIEASQSAANAPLT